MPSHRRRRQRRRSAGLHHPHVHRLLGDVLEDLTTGEITEVAGVVMTHQQLWRLLGHSVNALNVGRCRGGGLNLIIPVVTEVIGEVLLERLTTVQLGHGDRTHHRMIGQLANLLLHGG